MTKRWYSTEVCLDERVTAGKDPENAEMTRTCLWAKPGMLKAELDKYARGPILMPDFYLGSTEDIRAWSMAGDAVKTLADRFKAPKRSS